jgi:hypothetical protein
MLPLGDAHARTCAARREHMPERLVSEIEQKNLPCLMKAWTRDLCVAPVQSYSTAPAGAARRGGRARASDVAGTVSALVRRTPSRAFSAADLLLSGCWKILLKPSLRGGGGA